jgi:3-phosphoglycerate kinase
MLAEKGFAINADDLEGRIRTAVKTADRKSEQEGRDALMAMSHMMGQLTERMSQYENENKELQQQIEQVSSKQDGRISDLEKMLADQQKYIDEKLNEREIILTESLRRSLDETKKEIAISQEQEAQKENRGLFARLFGKKG